MTRRARQPLKYCPICKKTRPYTQKDCPECEAARLADENEGWTAVPFDATVRKPKR